MQFTVSSSQLLSRLALVSSVISPKPIMSILGNVLFEVSENTLKLTSSDLELTLCSSIQIENATGKVSVAMPPQLLKDTLRELPEQNVCFEINEENLAVVMRTNTGKYDFIGVKGEDFPDMPKQDGDIDSFVTTADVLHNGIARTLFATATEDLRPTMTGVYLDLSEEGLTFVATDAHKMARIVNKTVTSAKPASIIVPKKAANALKNILAKSTEETTVEFDAKNIFITTADYSLIARKIEGRYPNYRAVIPTNNPFAVTLDRTAFFAAVKRVSVYTTQSTGLMRLDITNNNLRLTAQDIDFSTAALEQVPCKYEGNPLSIGFKAALLTETLSYIDNDAVVIRLADQSRAGIVVPSEQKENEDVLMLLMPMMLPE